MIQLFKPLKDVLRNITKCDNVEIDVTMPLDDIANVLRSTGKNICFSHFEPIYMLDPEKVPNHSINTQTCQFGSTFLKA